MPRWRRIMSIDRNCSCRSGSIPSRRWTQIGGARAIEYTRFPYTISSNDSLIEEDGLLLRAADLIGQLGDPNYSEEVERFYEFEEIGLNKTLGYVTPADIVYKYPQLYWSKVAPQIQPAIRAPVDSESLRQCVGPSAR